MTKMLLVGAGGFFGAVARYKLGGLVFRTAGEPTLPIGTIVVNLSGCLVIGLLAGMIEKQHILSMDLRLLLITGFLGGFTTFSAFGFETLYLVKRHEMLLAATNVTVSVVGGLLAVWLGFRLGELVR